MKAVFIEWYLPNIPFISTIDLVKLWESKYLLHTSRIYEFYSLWICLITLDSGPVECPPQFQGHLVIPFNSIEALVSSLQFYGHTVLMFFVFFNIWIIFDIILSCCWWHFIHQGCWSGEFYKPTILQTQTGLIHGVPPVIPMCFPRIAWVCILGNVPSSIAQKRFRTTRCLQNAAKLILPQATLFIKGTNQINQHLPFIKTGTANQKYCFDSEHESGRSIL